MGVCSVDMGVADFCWHWQEDCASKLTRAVPVAMDTAGQGGSHGQWGPHGNVRFLLGSGVHTGAGSHQALGLVHTGRGLRHTGQGCSHWAGGWLTPYRGPPELTPSSSKCCWCLVGCVWAARHVADFPVRSCKRNPCRPRIRVRRLWGTVQRRNDIKVLDLGSNRVKPNQQTKPAEMGGCVGAESKGRKEGFRLLLGDMPTCATSGSELCVVFTVQD